MVIVYIMLDVLRFLWGFHALLDKRTVCCLLQFIPYPSGELQYAPLVVFTVCMASPPSVPNGTCEEKLPVVFYMGRLPDVRMVVSHSVSLLYRCL